MWSSTTILTSGAGTFEEPVLYGTAKPLALLLCFNVGLDPPDRPYNRKTISVRQLHDCLQSPSCVRQQDGAAVVGDSARPSQPPNSPSGRAGIPLPPSGPMRKSPIFRRGAEFLLSPRMGSGQAVSRSAPFLRASRGERKLCSNCALHHPCRLSNRRWKARCHGRSCRVRPKPMAWSDLVAGS
jgi:hypothetical protein